MKITDVTAHHHGDALLVTVQTDSELVGVGESGCWAYPEAVAGIVQRFAGYLVGSDPSRIEHHWHTMWRMGPFRGATIGAAVSALDAALWDIAGQRLGVPTYELLGGPYRDRIRLHKAIGGADAEALARTARLAADEGFTALKFGVVDATAVNGSVNDLVNEAVERTTAVRDATDGHVDLILEIHRSLTPHQVPAVLDAVRPLRPLFVEDPIQIDTIDVQAGLAVHGLTLGLGERWQSPWEVREALAVHGPFVVRSDVNMAGGITAARKIAGIAEASHAQVSWHNWLSPVSDASTLTVDATIPNVLTHEHVPGNLTVAGIETDWRVDDGHMVPPTTAGLGVRVDVASLPEEITYLGRPLHDIPQRNDGSVAFAM